MDIETFLRGLDAIFAARRGQSDAEPYLLAGLAEADAQGDLGAALSIRNELAGFYRSVSRHDEAVESGRRALALVETMHLAGTDAHATTLTNLATALRAAGRPDEARDRYREALAVAGATMPPTDRRLAALHNNLSMLLGDLADHAGAKAELVRALAILAASSVDPAADLDIATTHTNLVLECLALGEDDEAADHARRALQVYRATGQEREPHYASALAGYAQTCVRLGRYGEAVEAYRAALEVIAECYGTGTDAYAVTAANLAEAEAEAQAVADTRRVDDAVRAGDGEPRGIGSSAGTDVRPPTASRTDTPTASARPTSSSSPGPTPSDPTPPTPPPPAPATSGLDLARAFWETHGRPLVDSRYPAYRGRIAAGLVGHGSECYGFDEATSRDHDFGPGFCLWLTADDFAAIGPALQADYDALPQQLDGVGPRVTTPRASGEGRRVGVFEIGDFYRRITGYPEPPPADRPHEWLLLDEATLAAATNGVVFADPLGEFGRVRHGFRAMPPDVQVALISRRLGMAAQAGQYNVPRMLARGDGEAAWLAVAEFARAIASLVFLLNKPTSAGYLPYYKWQPAALRRLSARPGSRLPEVAGELAEVLRLASAACFGGAGFGEGGRGAAPARARLTELVEAICGRVVGELQAQGLTSSGNTFLEHQRIHVEAHIGDEWLRST